MTRAGRTLWIQLGLMLFVRSVLADEPPRTAFFYGPHPPAALFQHFDLVVVEPDHVAAPPPSGASKVFAYVSVGEVNRSRAYRKDIPAALILGGNPDWQSDVVDTRSARWRTFLLDRVIEPLWAKGYRGFFLDTLDSYERVTADARERRAHATGIAAILEAIHQRHPDAALLVNRGFDALAMVPPGEVAGIVVESLLETWSRQTGYHAVASAETEELRRRIEAVRARLHVPVTVIDYVPESDHALRRATAQRILALGYDAWVTTPALDEIGTGRVEIVPRKVMVLIKSAPGTALITHDAVVLVAPILQYLGYRVELVDVRKPLPPVDLAEVAGIVVDAPEGTDDEPALRRWILTQVDRGLRVAFLEGFGFEPDAPFLARLGLASGEATATRPMAIAQTTDYFGFEAPVRALAHEVPPVLSADAGRSILRVKDAAGHVWDGGVLAPWGGAAFGPYVLAEGLEEERRWILDPFRFLKDALALPPLPVPDVTTEAGRRILTVHIDGDAFVSRAERRDGAYCGQVILDEVLKRYALPHTVSVIEGEVGPRGLYPQDAPKLEAIARTIFALPNVEIGTHLYSHPFDWREAEAGLRGPPLPFLPVPQYTFSLDREIRGSIDYIQERLAPPNKRVTIVQWTGDCLPSARAVAAADRAGVVNVNGGGATRTEDTPSLTRGSGIGAELAPGVFQVFAPVENENVYTNDWHGPFYGYRHAIQTFELNERPRRLSTIPLYYHFYSAAKSASREALHEVYRWALSQETTPLFMSEYAAKVRDFERVTLARRVDGQGFEVAGYGALHTLRLAPSLGWPDLARSVNVAGVRDVLQGRYVHLVPGARASLALREAPPDAPYVEHTNGVITAWNRRGELQVEGHVPLVLTVGGTSGTCTLSQAGAVPVVGRRVGPSVVFTLPNSSTGQATLACR